MVSPLPKAIEHDEWRVSVELRGRHRPRRCRRRAATQALVEAFRPIDVGDGQGHDLDLHVDRPELRGWVELSMLASVLLMLASVCRLVFAAASRLDSRVASGCP